MQDKKVTAEDVKALSKETGVGLMYCKKALFATNGNKEKAIEWLKENYQAVIHMRNE